MKKTQTMKKIMVLLLLMSMVLMVSVGFASSDFSVELMEGTESFNAEEYVDLTFGTDESGQTYAYLNFLKSDAKYTLFINENLLKTMTVHDTARLRLHKGENVIKVEVKKDDGTGAIVSKTQGITEEKPTLNVHPDIKGLSTDKIFVGNVSTGTTVLFNDKEITVDKEGYFEIEITDEEGKNENIITAVDENGNTSTYEFEPITDDDVKLWAEIKAEDGEYTEEEVEIFIEKELTLTEEIIDVDEEEENEEEDEDEEEVIVEETEDVSKAETDSEEYIEEDAQNTDESVEVVEQKGNSNKMIIILAIVLLMLLVIGIVIFGKRK